MRTQIRTRNKCGNGEPTFEGQFQVKPDMRNWTDVVTVWAILSNNDLIYNSRITGHDAPASSTKSLRTTKIVRIIVANRAPLCPAAYFRLHLKLTCKRRFAVNIFQTVNLRFNQEISLSQDNGEPLR